MAAMLANPAARRNLVDALVQYDRTQQFTGMALDFEQVPDKSQHDFLKFVHEFGAGFHARI